MEPQKPLSHITAGLIIAGVLAVFSTVVSFAGLTGNSAASWMQPLIIIAGLVILIRQYGKAHDNTLSFGNLFAYGFKTTAVFTVISVAFTVLFLLLFPDLKEKTFELAREQMEKDSRITDEQIDQALEISRKFFWVGIVGGSVIATVIQGAIGSLIGAAATKRQPNDPFRNHPNNPFEQQAR